MRLLAMKGGVSSEMNTYPSMKSSTSTGRSSNRLLRISRMIGKSRPRRRMRLMRAAVLPSKPFLPQSTIMHPIAASVFTATSASSMRRALTTSKPERSISSTI